jgi:hypothetical protein
VSDEISPCPAAMRHWHVVIHSSSHAYKYVCRHLMRDTCRSQDRGKPSFQAWQLVGHSLLSILSVPCPMCWLAECTLQAERQWMASCNRDSPHAQVSTGTLRKFMGALDIPLSLFEAAGSADQLVCHVAASPLRIARAMAQHHSQWVWCVLALGLCSRTCDGAASRCLAGNFNLSGCCQNRVILPCRFRKLFVVFSRYTYVNTLQRIDI